MLRGEDAILNCSTDAVSATGRNPIAWNYDNDIISYSPCTSQNPGFVASPPDSAADCNIRALGSWQHGISGAYRCNDRTERAVAMLIVLGEHNKLFCSLIRLFSFAKLPHMISYTGFRNGGSPIHHLLPSLSPSPPIPLFSPFPSLFPSFSLSQLQDMWNAVSSPPGHSGR